MELKEYIDFPIKEYTEPKYMTSGSTSNIYKITKIDNGKEYVLKVIKSSYKHTGLNEFEISKKLTCENPNIICYENAYLYKNDLAFVLNYIPNYTLFNYIN